MSLRAAVYARVSTTDQAVENQLTELRRYVGARGWQLSEFVERGVSGAKDSRPELDKLLRLAKRREIDVIVVWALDRFGRSLKHLIALLEDLNGLGVAFVSLKEGLDWTTPSGRLQVQLLGAIAEFERARLQERVRAGVARARREGRRLGRPRRPITSYELRNVAELSVRQAALELNVSPSVIHRARKAAAAGTEHLGA